MIQSFRHKGLRKFFESGGTPGIQPHHAKRLRMLLAALDTSQSIEDMNVPGFRLHPLKGSECGRWSVWVNGHWRLRQEMESSPFRVLWEVIPYGECGCRTRLQQGLHGLTTLHYDLARRSAISLSGGRNEPLRRCGGTIASMASSFSVGSARR